MYERDLRIVLKEAFDTCVQFVGYWLEQEGNQLISYAVNPNISINSNGIIIAIERKV